MSTATQFLQQLAAQASAEQAGPRQLADDELALVGTWHWCGATSISLPAESEGYGPGDVTRYGATFQISAQRLRNSFDRYGESTLVAMLSSEDAQLQMFGEIVARRGEWPADVLPFRPGSVEAVEAAQDAKRRAWRIGDPDERQRELARLRKVFGGDYFGDASQQRSVDYGGGSGRAALLQPGP